MKIKAKLSYLRISPRKVRLVADMIRGKKVEEARTVLNFTIKKGSLPLVKLLDQAMANARNNLQVEPYGLYVSEIKVDEGPKLKRWRARSRGQAYEIQKKTCHITLTLEGKTIVKKDKKKDEQTKKKEENNKKENEIKNKDQKKIVGKPKPEASTVSTGLKPGKSRSTGWRQPFRRKAF
jgi:large subunit ribosomal protein L22